ncbi:MAG TPA: hypothetical protein VI793_22065 [Anaerolineales bacterium]|nr:hypothetical protein [Anaerolineales bacterium]
MFSLLIFRQSPVLKGLVVSAPSGQIGPPRTPGAEELARLDAHYRQMLIDSFKNLDFKGLTTSARPMLLPLERVYVQLRAVAEVPEAADEFTPEERRVLRHLEEREREGRDDKQRDAEARELYLRLDAAQRERWSRERLERFSIAESLKNAERRGLVILGDPGSGKTTLLHFAALVFAQGPETVAKHLGVTGGEADRLPIFAPLAFYDDMLTRVNPDLTIGEFLGLYYEKRCEMTGLAPLFQRAIDSGRALVLLDGLDEVIEEDSRKFVAGQASAFIRRVIARGNRVLLTSRIYGYRAAPLSVDLPHVTVLDFRREEIELFARQWNEVMAEWEYGDRPPEQRQRLAQESERNLLEEIRSNPGVAAKLDALLAKERDPQVLDSLFNALQSLASAPAER